MRGAQRKSAFPPGLFLSSKSGWTAQIGCALRREGPEEGAQQKSAFYLCGFLSGKSGETALIGSTFRREGPVRSAKQNSAFYLCGFLSSKSGTAPSFVGEGGAVGDLDCVDAWGGVTFFFVPSSLVLLLG